MTTATVDKFSEAPAMLEEVLKLARVELRLDEACFAQIVEVQRQAWSSASEETQLCKSFSATEEWQYATQGVARKRRFQAMIDSGGVGRVTRPQDHHSNCNTSSVFDGVKIAGL